MSKIILKKSSVTGKVPLAGDLDYGELALNYTDGVLYYKDSSNAIQSISTGGGSGTTTTVSSTPPASPGTGDVWVDSDTGIKYTYIDDGDSQQWVELEADLFISSGVGTGGGGATGGGTDQVFYENDQTVTTSYTITTGKSALTAGPVTIATGASVTIPTGSRWVIV